jgi:hypothetical protein
MWKKLFKINESCAYITQENHWRLDPTDPCNLSKDRIMIRTLNSIEQLRQWKNQQLDGGSFFVFSQQMNNEMHPRREKEELLAKMDTLNFPFEYLTPENQNNWKYRSLAQGDNSSLKGVVLDFVTPDRIAKRRVLKCDFSRKSEIVYHCINSSYVFDFSTPMPIFHERSS